MSENILKATDAEFDKLVINSDRASLVDYWAEWCGPCKMIGSNFEEVANEMSGKVTIAKLNVDENHKHLPKYGIRGIPH